MATWAEECVQGIELGDRRLERRLITLLETLAEQPESSIPAACPDWAATQAAYRFFDNEAVEPEHLVACAAQATLHRCRGQRVVLAVQDTTDLNYSGHTQTRGLGPLETPRMRGLLMHTTFTVSEEGVPLGLIAQEVWARDPLSTGKRDQRKQLPVEAKESAKWLRALQQTEQRLCESGADVVTVADREADLYELFAVAQELQGDWVIRARHDRKVAGEAGKLLAAVEAVSPCIRTTVEVSRADDHPARQATVEVRRVQVMLQPPTRAKGVVAAWWAAHPERKRLAPEKLCPLRVGVILVTEVAAPAGCKPLRWLLLTSLPVETPEQVLRCVGYYRRRWLVERYHYVLKSGYQVEKLQLETAERLKRALAVYALVAWRLLWLTHEARVHPTRPCTELLEEEAWRVLWALDRPMVAPPVAPPDLQTVVRQIAKLGGFLGRERDGTPGVKTLWRGLRRLQDTVLAYHLLKEHPDLLSAPPPGTCV